MIPLPAGADPKWSDSWEVVAGDPVRMVWSEQMMPAGSGVDVRVVCTQAGDGHIVTDNPAEPIAVHWDDTTGYPPAVARQVAAALIKAADLADQWAKRQLRLVT